MTDESHTRGSNRESPRSIAVVGASARAAAFSVLRSGRKAVTADLFADADLVRHCTATRVAPYPEGFLDWLAAIECDAWLYTGALENYPDLVDRLAQIRPLLGNSGAALRQCRNPLALQEILRANGLQFPETRTTSEGLPRDGSWLCKTYSGSSGSGVWELTDPQAMHGSEAKKRFFQKRVEGQTVSVVFALSKTWTKTLGMTDQLIGSAVCGANGFQYSGSLGIKQRFPSSIHDQIERLAEALATQFKLRGLVGVDLVLDDKQLWVLEVNPRYTASVEIVERISGISAIEAQIAACSGIEPVDFKQTKLSERNHAKAVLYAKRDIEVREEFHSWAIAQTGSHLESGLADVPAVGSNIPEGRPVLTLFASTAQSRDDRFLHRHIAEVEARLYGSENRL